MNAQHLSLSGQFTGMATLMDPDYLRRATAQGHAAAASSTGRHVAWPARGLALATLVVCAGLVALACFG